ncbi:MAG: Mut7-C RNAse domain-containing protein [Candidatus Norongarragalinales archaeon]
MKTSFVADAMLGKLCRWLRLVGVRVAYAPEEKIRDDDELIKFAANKNAVLLTRDEELAKKARDYCRVFLIKPNDLRSQFREAARTLEIKIPKRETQALCPKCGSRLKRVAKKTVKALVWPRVYTRHKAFWRCANERCAQIYWKGTHVREIRRVLKEIRSSRVTRRVKV